MGRFTDQFHEGWYRFKKRHPRLVMTVVIFIVVPLASGLILGYEMSYNVTDDIPTVVVDHDHSQFSRDYINDIENNQFFHVVEHADQDERIKELMDQGKAFVGVIIPENFYVDMLDGKSPRILTIYDGSSISVATSAKSAMTEILLTVKGGYMKSVFEGKQSVVPAQVMNLVTPIDVTYRILFDPTKNFRNFLLPGMLAGVIQVGISVIGSERGWENQNKKMFFFRHLAMIAGWGTLATLSIILCLGIQYVFFGMPYEGTLVGGLVLTWLFAVCITTIGYCVGSFLSDRTFATQIASLLMLPTTILGGYTWPVLGMPEAYKTVSKCIPFSYYSDAIRSLCLKPLEFHHILGDIKAMGVFILLGVVVLALIKLLKRRKEPVQIRDEFDLEVAE